MSHLTHPRIRNRAYFLIDWKKRIDGKMQGDFFLGTVESLAIFAFGGTLIIHLIICCFSQDIRIQISIYIKPLCVGC